jgi:hypothetical protein
MEMPCIFFEVGLEFLNVIQISFVLGNVFKGLIFINVSETGLITEYFWDPEIPLKTFKFCAPYNGA